VSAAARPGALDGEHAERIFTRFDERGVCRL